MGDRVNIAMQDNGSRVYFYGHWSGYNAPHTVQQALDSKAGRARASDGPYLSRIVFDHFTASAASPETGFGISASVLDNEYPVIVVDVDAQEVRFEDENRARGHRDAIGKAFTFDDYCTLDMDPGNPWGAIEKDSLEDKRRPFTCPQCGESNVEYLEDILSSHRIVGVRTDGTVIIDESAKVHWDCTTNERFSCQDCGHEWPAPDGGIETA